jgi:hypothetical protein
MDAQFLFATGIENSNPTIDNGRQRVDEMEKCKHYQFWQKDFDLVQELFALRPPHSYHLARRGEI